MMFFCESFTLRHERERCIMSWSRPVIAISVNIPPKNCFRKYCGWLGSSKKNTRDMSLSETAWSMLPNVNPNALLMNTVQRTIAVIIQMVFRESIQITAFTPPRYVYNISIATVTATLTQNGIPSGPKTITWSEMQARNSLTEAPNILEMKKNHAPVLYDDTPNRLSR